MEQPARGTTLSTECSTEEEHRKGNEQTFHLNIKSQLAGLPFTWNFNCRHVTNLMVIFILRTNITKEGNILFNDAHNTFYLRIYGIGHMVKDHSDSKRETPLPPH